MRIANVFKRYPLPAYFVLAYAIWYANLARRKQPKCRNVS
jgi:hypothetical protein